MKRLVFGCLLCLFAVAVPPLVMVILFAHSLPVARGMLPGQMEVNLKGTKKYVLWYDYVCTYKGKQYKLDKNLPSDWTFLITGPGGNHLEPHIPLQITDNAGKKMSSIKEVEFQSGQEGKYMLTAAGSGEKRPFSVRPEIGSIAQKVFLPMFAGSIIVGLVGFTLVMWGGYDLIMMYSRKRKEKSVL